MRLDYTYKIHRLALNGMATVEYSCPELGSVTKMFVVPYDKGEVHVRRRVIEQFPHDLFHSKYLVRTGGNTKPFLISGTMSVDLDDRFYDVQEMSTA